MILYLDASALVKRYVTEHNSDDVNQTVLDANLVGAAVISRAEVAAAIAKSVRMGVLQHKEGLTSLQNFRTEWSSFAKIQVTEAVVSHADTLAWEYDLRGYDAVHLSAALFWQETIKEPVTLATFDQSLWQAAKQIGMIPFPIDLPALLSVWRTTNSKRRKK